MRFLLDYKFGKDSERGFSLLELIIAVLVIGIVVSIALPALTRSRLNANDELARTTVRTVSTAFETYRSAAQPPSYPLTLLDLTAAIPPYLDLILTTDSSLTKSGHDCSILATAANTFSFACSPTTAGTTGEAHVCIKETGEVFTSTTGFTAGCVESATTTTTTTTTSSGATTTTGGGCVGFTSSITESGTEGYNGYSYSSFGGSYTDTGETYTGACMNNTPIYTNGEWYVYTECGDSYFIRDPSDVGGSDASVWAPYSGGDITNGVNLEDLGDGLDPGWVNINIGSTSPGDC